MTRLHDLHEEQGQSPWLDNLQRSFLSDGTLERLIADGVRGLTSNPTIFAKAISGSDDYDAQLSEAFRRGSVTDAYWEAVVQDIQGACDVFAPLHAESGGADGNVSIEVAPSLAHDTEGTTAAAEALWRRVDRPNVMIKIPATAEGVDAIRRTIAKGINVNVTLIFSLERYADVIDAFQAGISELAGLGGDVSKVRSVGSFFVSRVDTEIDRQLDALGKPEALNARGHGAVDQAKLAYALAVERFSTPAWAELEAAGANRQRPLWASTSTKNKAYPDLLYVDSLIGPGTVNTMPDATIEAFLDHGTVARTIDVDLDEARRRWEALASVGVDVDAVATQLEDEGVASFTKSFDELIQALQDKATALS
jgi:transaldolase